ncbi:oxidoreductase, 2OG-Fe(II) oxygenase family protein [Actinidia rufa]|uniref:Oxidoreductase, 2OG-Fe(II) oxygenase family protein n=1 Tax=Actinidia rufa TaxID=165716 RepID=A0A7J0FJA3_9ERIC|nr:oxidoreductase, 2OG-Fe(II) oxygenase family protein [Actinidia rufa]
MTPSAGVESPSERSPVIIPATVQPAPAMMSEAFAKDAIIAWFRGEFAAANAIIDALCNHLKQMESGGGRGSEYESSFAAIHRRRLNWIPILQMQKYFSIADVVLELRRVAERKMETKGGGEDVKKIEEVKEEKSREVPEEESAECNENGGGEVVDDSPVSEITDTGSQEVQPVLENIDLCSKHEDCEARRDQIKMTKGFIVKESVKGHMVNVVRGLKLYEDVFSDFELSKLNDFVNELRVAGRNGELSGHLEPIPTLLQGVIDHLVQWNVISENRKPNSCIINFFDEGAFSQPFLKPPHLEQPISTLLLSESMMAFGRTLVCDNDGNYKGSLMLSLKEGSLLVMRGNSSDMARHVMCPSPNKRVSITFFRVRPDKNENNSSTIPPLTRAVTLWQPGVPNPYPIPDEPLNGYEAMDVIPKWGVLRAPLLMLAPIRPMVLSHRRGVPHGGTGVFLPWTVRSRKPAKHLPPRAQKGRFLALPSPVETHVSEPASDGKIV